MPLLKEDGATRVPGLNVKDHIHQTKREKRYLPPANPPRPWAFFIVAFCISAMLASVVIIYSEHFRTKLLRADMAVTGGNHVHMLKDSLERSLSVTYALAALVRQGQGSVWNFDAIGKEMLQLYPGTANLQLAPDGVTRQVVPLEGNEKVLGLDQLHDPIRARESILAKETGELTLAGPFPLVQGGLGLVGRMPVFLGEGTDHRHFWGFTVTLLRVPESLASADLDRLQERGIAYKLWRTHPNAGNPQIIDESSPEPLVDPIMHPVRISNAEWILSLAPSNGWGSPVGLAFKSLCGVLSSLVLAYLAYLLAILKRHKTELESLVQARTRELSASEFRYRTLFQQSGDYIFVMEVGRDGIPIIVEANDAAIQAHGYAKEEIIGKPISFLDPDSTLSDHKERITPLNNSGLSLFNVRHRRKDGTFFDVEVKAQTLKLGQEHHVITAERDITERKRTDSALRESNERLQKVFDSQPDAIFVLDARVPASIVTCNKAASRIFGYEPDEMRGTTTEKLHVDKMQLAKFQEVLWEALKNEGSLRNFEFTMKRKDGSVFPSNHTVMVLTDENGVRTGWISVVCDLTERKEIETRLQQAQKMESIGTLAGGIAHDFNNILFPIIGMSEMLLEDLPRDSLEYENANQILKAGLRGSNLVQQILSFSRQTEHKMMPVCIQMVLREVVGLIRATVPSNIEIKQHIQGDCGLVRADPVQIHQIAMNLMTNAYHAVEPNNGEIRVVLKEAHLGIDDLPIDGLQPGKHAMLTVSDTGSGIDPEVMGKIFEPYFTTKEQGKGTGLGLAVVYGIVKEYDGGIQVDSQVGVGTTFNVYFPLIANPEGESSTEIHVIHPSHNQRVLLVDDEEAIVQLEKQILERLGYNVTALTSSLDALNLFNAAPSAFDLIISDMAMPNMTGDKLAEELISIRSDIPIILCTGFSERINREKAAAIGVKGFLMKPTVKAEMAKMIRKVLDEAKSNDQQ